LPECLWGEVLHYVVHIDNMSSTKAVGGMTPYQKLRGKKPDLKNLKRRSVRFREDVAVGSDYVE
ncbi:hypothetical protein PHYSODRAFT_420678, partial [Phytophthora sojae]